MTVVKNRHSSEPGKVPTVSQLTAGEICVNTADGVLYVKKVTSSPAETENIEKFIPESQLPFSIPVLLLKTGLLNDELFAYWNSKDTLFFNHSPQIFLFRWTFAHNYNSSNVPSYFWRDGNRRWRHPRHLKLTESKVYHTEFTCGQKGVWTTVPVSLTEWCSGDINTEIIMYRKSRKKLSIRPTGDIKSISVHFAVAITVIDPTTQKRIWGPMTPFWVSCRRAYDMSTGIYKLKRLFELNK